MLRRSAHDEALRACWGAPRMLGRSAHVGALRSAGRAALRDAPLCGTRRSAGRAALWTHNNFYFICGPAIATNNNMHPKYANIHLTLVRPLGLNDL